MVEDVRASSLKPLAELAASQAAALQVVFTDIDDTLTRDGLLEREAYDAIWDLHAAGIQVVAVTGRPAGWCDHVARMWPVAGVVGENGALAFRYDRSARRMDAFHAASPAERVETRSRLDRLRDRILKAVPGAGVASDQPYRLYDLAIDFCEDVSPLPRAEVDRIVSLFEEEGATAKVSSIHVNGWFGDFDKVTMVRRFAVELGFASDAGLRAASLYVGDSPNDAPAFRFFDISVGVANIRGFLDQLDCPPTFVTKETGGRGFAELARHLLETRAKPSESQTRRK